MCTASCQACPRIVIVVIEELEMRGRRSVASVIIGAALSIGACEESRPAPEPPPPAKSEAELPREMTFRELDPDFGGLQGGKTVAVLGKHIRLDIGYAVYFGEQRSPQVSIRDHKALLAVTPRVPSPTVVDVTIRADNGQVFVIRRGFEYVDQAGSLLEAPAPEPADSPPPEGATTDAE